MHCVIHTELSLSVVIRDCLLQVSEFSQEISTENMQLHPRGVFVIYEWRLEDINEHVDDSASEMESVNSLDTHSSHSPTSSLITAALVTTTPTVTHIVTFKCIGAVRDEKQQKAWNMRLLSE